MKFQKSLTSTFAAAALAVGLSHANPASSQENMTSAPEAVTQNTQTTFQSSLGNVPAVELNPVLPVEILGGMGGIAAILLLLAARQRMRGAWARAAASTMLVAAIANPTITTDDRAALPTQIAIVVDKSASQMLDGRDSTTTASQADLARQITGIENVEVRIIEVGSARNGVPIDGTNLFSDLSQGIADIPPDQLGAVILLTDGQSDDLPEDISKLTGGAPLHVLVSGRPDEHDRRIVLESAPAYGVVNENVTIRFHVADDGAAPNSTSVTVTLLADGTPITSQQVKPGESTEMTVNIPHGGANILQLETPVVPGEVTATNNRTVTTVQGVREKMKVLLISGEPHAGERAWRNLLTSDPAVDLVHFTVMRPPGKEDDAPLNELSLISLPMRDLFTNKLQDFDMVILDRYQYRGILPPPYLANITKYVNEGGALLVAAGPDYAGSQSIYNTPLSPVLPAAPTGQVHHNAFAPKISETGERHPVTRNLEDAHKNSESEESDQWGRWFRIVDVQDAKGDVLMQGPDDKPLLVLNREAQGRVAMLLSDTSWLWSRGYEGGGPYAELLQRATHWLLKEPALEEEALRARTDNGELIIERQTMAGSTGQVTVETPSGKIVNTTLEQERPGLWRATLPATELGLYRVQQGDKSVLTSAGTNSPRELANTISSTEKLSPFAAQTGGKTHRIASAQDPAKINIPRLELRTSGEPMSGGDWIGIRKTEATEASTGHNMPLIRGFLGLSLLFGALAIAWHREGGGFNRASRRKESAAPQNNKPKGP